VCFDGFALELGRRQLTRDGEVLHRTPKAYDLLALLVDHALRVVTKRELHERLWKDTFISDTTLVGVVKELRRVLDDRSGDRPIIRTAHRVGYAFCRLVAVSTAVSSGGEHWLLVDERRIVMLPGANVIGPDPAAVVARFGGRLASSRTYHRRSRGCPARRPWKQERTTMRDRRILGECSLRDGDVN
jgi:DNA-binding winged helix-turn-helix (wHTH) protein